MHRTRALAASVLAAGLLAAPVAAAASAGGPTAADATSLAKVIVAFDGDVTASVLDRLDDLGVVRGLELRAIDAVAVTAPADVVPALRSLPGVVAVEPQRPLELHLFASRAQIGADAVDTPATYEVDGTSFERPGVTGAGVTVGIIDSGIFSQHPGFGGRVVAGYNFEFSELPDSGGIPAEQWDAYAEATGASALQDEVGHGTHVAGTVGGSGAGATSGEDLRGIAPSVEFVSLKIASAANGVAEDIGFEENALAAIDYLIRHPDLGVTLTNNSWGLLETEPGTGGVGEPTDFDAAKAMVRAASEAGITMVFSAGNDGPEPGSINEDPGGAPEAITVAAACKGEEHGGSCPLGQITDFSSRGAEDGSGPQVDVSAPGDQIKAPVSPSILAPLTECEAPQDDPLYYCISGTSMASPHVAGVVALMQELKPDLTPAEAERCIVDTADDMLEPGFDIASGHGLVDTPGALACVHQLTVAAGAGGPATGAGAGDGGVEAAPVALPTTGGGLVGLGLVGLLGTGLLRRR